MYLWRSEGKLLSNEYPWLHYVGLDKVIGVPQCCCLSFPAQTGGYQDAVLEGVCLVCDVSDAQVLQGIDRCWTDVWVPAVRKPACTTASCIPFPSLGCRA